MYLILTYTRTWISTWTSFVTSVKGVRKARKKGDKKKCMLKVNTILLARDRVLTRRFSNNVLGFRYPETMVSLNIFGLLLIPCFVTIQNLFQVLLLHNEVLVL